MAKLCLSHSHQPSPAGQGREHDSGYLGCLRVWPIWFSGHIFQRLSAEILLVYTLKYTRKAMAIYVLNQEFLQHKKHISGFYATIMELPYPPFSKVELLHRMYIFTKPSIPTVEACDLAGEGLIYVKTLVCWQLSKESLEVLFIISPLPGNIQQCYTAFIKCSLGTQTMLEF